MRVTKNRTASWTISSLKLGPMPVTAIVSLSPSPVASMILNGSGISAMLALTQSIVE